MCILSNWCKRYTQTRRFVLGNFYVLCVFCVATVCVFDAYCRDKFTVIRFSDQKKKLFGERIKWKGKKNCYRHWLHLDLARLWTFWCSTHFNVILSMPKIQVKESRITIKRKFSITFCDWKCMTFIFSLSYWNSKCYTTHHRKTAKKFRCREKFIKIGFYAFTHRNKIISILKWQSVEIVR